MEYALFVAINFAAALVSAVFGLGTSLIVLAIGSHILPVKETIALATVLFTAATITKTALFGKHIDWKIAGIMAIASLPFAALGAILLEFVPAELLKRLLGLMVLVYLVLTVFEKLPSFKIGISGLIVGSAAYGFVSGLLGSGNLIKAILFREMNIANEAFVGAMAATSVLANVAKLLAYSQSGILASHLVWPIAGLTAGAIMAALAGKLLLQNVSTLQFGLGVRVVLAASAVGLLW